MALNFHKLLILIFIFHNNTFIWSQCDTIKNYRVGLSTGLGYYGSTDAIYAPYRFEGYSIYYSLWLKKNSILHQSQLRMVYSVLHREPYKIKTYQSYLLLSYDNEQRSYEWPSTASLIQRKTVLFSQDFRHVFRTPINIFKNSLYVGYAQHINCVYNKNIPNIEILSLSLSFNLSYTKQFYQRFLLQIENQLSFLSLHFRNTYASIQGNALQQLSIMHLYNNYGKISTLPQYFLLNSSFHCEYRLTQKVSLMSYVSIQYTKVRYPRLFISLDQYMQLGILWKINAQKK